MLLLDLLIGNIINIFTAEGGKTLGDDRMIGEILALSAALCWAISAVLYKKALYRFGYYATNFIRTFFATIFILGILPVIHPFSLTLTFNLLILLFIGSVFNLIIGDTFYFRGLKKMGVSRTQSIASSYPFYSMILAAIFLKEGVTTPVIIGTPLIIGGIALISWSQYKENESNSEGMVKLSS